MNAAIVYPEGGKGQIALHIRSQLLGKGRFSLHQAIELQQGLLADGMTGNDVLLGRQADDGGLVIGQLNGTGQKRLFTGSQIVVHTGLKQGAGIVHIVLPPDHAAVLSEALARHNTVGIGVQISVGILGLCLCDHINIGIESGVKGGIVFVTQHIGGGAERFINQAVMKGIAVMLRLVALSKITEIIKVPRLFKFIQHIGQCHLTGLIVDRLPRSIDQANGGGRKKAISVLRFHTEFLSHLTGYATASPLRKASLQGRFSTIANASSPAVPRSHNFQYW